MWQHDMYHSYVQLMSITLSSRDKVQWLGGMDGVCHKQVGAGGGTALAGQVEERHKLQHGGLGHAPLQEPWVEIKLQKLIKK